MPPYDMPHSQKHEVVRHHCGKDHHILRNTNTNGDVEIIMFTDRRETPRLVLAEDEARKG